jgi:hypothetical protein
VLALSLSNDAASADSRFFRAQRTVSANQHHSTSPAHFLTIPSVDEDEDEDEDMVEIEETNIVGSRTRGKAINFAEAAEKMGDDLEDDDDDDDEDFEDEDEDEEMK